MFSPRVQRRVAAMSALIGLGATLAVGCSDDNPTLAVDDLRNTGDDCPVDVPAALDEADLGAAEITEVEVSDATNEEEVDDDSGLGRARGVLVECTISHAGHTLDVSLLASQEPAAPSLFAPLMQRSLDLSTEALGDLLDEILPNDTGKLAELPGDAPFAIANIDVDEAESAVVVVEGDDGSSRDHVDSVATVVVDELA